MGREAEGTAGVVALSFQPFAGTPLTRSLPSTPSASPRDPLQFFNSLLTGVPGQVIRFGEQNLARREGTKPITIRL